MKKRHVNASQQIVNKAWNFAHVQTLPPFSRPPINALDQLPWCGGGIESLGLVEVF